MMQFSYVSMGARNTRMLGGQFVNGVQSIGGAGRRRSVKQAAPLKVSPEKPALVASPPVVVFSSGNSSNNGHHQDCSTTPLQFTAHR